MHHQIPMPPTIWFIDNLCTAGLAACWKKSRDQYFPRLHCVSRGAHHLGTSMLCLWGCGSSLRGCISLMILIHLWLLSSRKVKTYVKSFIHVPWIESREYRDTFSPTYLRQASKSGSTSGHLQRFPSHILRVIRVRMTEGDLYTFMSTSSSSTQLELVQDIMPKLVINVDIVSMIVTIGRFLVTLCYNR